MSSHKRDRTPEPEQELLADVEAGESLEGDGLLDEEEEAAR